VEKIKYRQLVGRVHGAYPYYYKQNDASKKTVYSFLGQPGSKILSPLTVMNVNALSKRLLNGTCKN